MLLLHVIREYYQTATRHGHAYLYKTYEYNTGEEIDVAIVGGMNEQELETIGRDMAKEHRLPFIVW